MLFSKKRFALTWFCMGFLETLGNFTGHATNTAWFNTWWQPWTFAVFLASVCMLAFKQPAWIQYCIAATAFSIAEGGAVAIGTSTVADGNMFDTSVGERNWTSSQSLIMGAAIPFVNWIVSHIVPEHEEKKE